MALFLSTTINRIDKKGRVSVPAGFRASLQQGGGDQMVLLRSPASAALEGFPLQTMEDISARLDQFDMFSADQDDLATVIFAESRLLSFDSDGRITLPQDLIAHAGLSEHVAFVGLGKKFQIWAPDALEERKRAARDNVQDKNLTLPQQGGRS